LIDKIVTVEDILGL